MSADQESSSSVINNSEVDADEEESCPICLNSMSTPDNLHPVACPTACKFNFCIHCLSSLLASSKDDYQMASDGNRHVKVHLNCPNCRADISGCIEDTILLRRAALAEEMQKIPDSELSAVELQAKYWTEGDGLIPATDSEKKGGKNANNGGAKQPLAIDTTLFGGLEFCMSEQEQIYVTELMTSGYPDRLCQAAQILAGVAELIRKGITPTMCNANNNNATANTTDRGMGANANGTARAAAANATALRNARTNTAIGPSTSRDEVSNYQKQRERAARDKLRRPLPARMPLSVTLSTAEFEKMAIKAEQKELAPSDPNVVKPWWKGWLGGAGGVRAKTMTFVDDEWDGSVADAFARAKIGTQSGDQHIVLTRVGPTNPVEQMGVRNIISLGDRERRQEGLPPARVRRVLVGSVRGQAGKSGIMKGDVVTHVNGEMFMGDAAELNALLIKEYEDQGRDGVVMIVVNADVCTSEALRLRSRVK